MKIFFNKILIYFISLLPYQIVRIFAYKYVAGENVVDAIKLTKKLNQKGFTVTLDILGEHVKKINLAKKVTDEYIDLLKEINLNNLDCNLSIKPSHLGMDINTNIAKENILAITSVAGEYSNFIRIDMEDSSQTEPTINLYNDIIKIHANVGIVHQAYLYRTEKDIQKNAKLENFNFRLCKGIYKENSNIAIQERKKINKNFIKILEYAFKNNIYVGIATHDIKLIEESYNLIRKMNISKNNFEFQVLYGVPMSGWLEKHLSNNYKVRVYVPFGKDWYDYSIRRLKENPDIATYILYDIFKK